jgi:hypothetical protein
LANLPSFLHHAATVHDYDLKIQLRHIRRHRHSALRIRRSEQQVDG